MQLTDLTDSQKLSSAVMPFMLAGASRDSGLHNQVTVALQKRMAGNLSHYESPAAFIRTVANAIKDMPGMTRQPTDGESIDLALKMIHETIKAEPALAVDGQRRR